VVFPRDADFVTVNAAPGGSVVGRQRCFEVTLLSIQIKLQDPTAIAQVGQHVSQIIAGASNFFPPEGHNLHLSLCADTGDGKAVEMAFHLDYGEYQLGG